MAEPWEEIAMLFETYDLEDTGSAFNPWRDMVKQVPSGPHSNFGDYVLTEDACKRIADLGRKVALLTAERDSLEKAIDEIRRKDEVRADSTRARDIENGLIEQTWVGRGPNSPAALRLSCERIAELERDRDVLLVELQRSFMKLPTVPGDAIAWDGRNLDPHVVRCADEFAVLREQRDAAHKRIVELERRPDIHGMLAKFAELTGDPICADPEATEWVSWPETFVSTAGPHGGIGGQAITTFQVYGFRGGNHAMMCCAGKWRRWTRTSEMSWERGGV